MRVCKFTTTWLVTYLVESKYKYTSLLSFYSILLFFFFLFSCNAVAVTSHVHTYVHVMQHRTYIHIHTHVNSTFYMCTLCSGCKYRVHEYICLILISLQCFRVCLCVCNCTCGTTMFSYVYVWCVRKLMHSKNTHRIINMYIKSHTYVQSCVRYNVLEKKKRTIYNINIS